LAGETSQQPESERAVIDHCFPEYGEGFRRSHPERACKPTAGGAELALGREGSARPEIEVKNLETRESPQSF
jgi:hypothetical protein